jgi:hypothetical protein
MKRLFFVGFLTFLFLVCLSVVPSVRGSDMGSSWGFATDTRMNWASNTTYEEGWTGYFLGNSTTSFLGFNGYSGMFSVPVLRAVQGGSWWFWNDKDVVLVFNFIQESNSSHCIHVMVKFQGHEQTWGTQIDEKVFACVREDDSYSDFNGTWGELYIVHGYGVEAQPTALTGSDSWDLSGGQLYVRLSKNNSTSAIVSVYNWQVDKATWFPLINYTLGVSASFWTETIVCVEVYHSGHGEFDIHDLTDDCFNGSDYPSEPSGLVGGGVRVFGTWDGFVNLLKGAKIFPSWLTDFLGGFTGWINSFVSLLVPLFGLFLQLLPYAPIILGFWVLGVVVKSVNEGSFEPIGNMAMSIWTLASGLVHTIVAISSAIWNYIKFW